MRNALVRSLLSLAGVALALPVAAAAPSKPISLQDSFRIGTKGIVICTGETMNSSAVLVDMFDRGYSLVCRDAAVPVGQLYALRTRAGDPASRLSTLRESRAKCGPAHAEQVEGLGAVDALDCTLTDVNVAYRVYSRVQGDRLFVAEGLAGYDSALRLGLKTLIADRVVPGELNVATTGIGDPASFARVQAGTISPDRALAEAYLRNNSGNYAEAAEFFAALSDTGTKRAEALANEALQKSNLGDFGEADVLFAQAEPLVQRDPVVARQLRNFRAMHLLNQGKIDAAEAELDKPLDVDELADQDSIRNLQIDAETAVELTDQTPGARRIGGAEGLTPQDKEQILDGQQQQLKAAILRLRKKPDEAAALLKAAEAKLMVIRNGRVAATQWMRAQILGDLADIDEAAGRMAEAENHQQTAVQLVDTYYPGSAALITAKSRLGAFYVRTGRNAEALSVFRQIVGSDADAVSASPVLRRSLAAYFGLLVQQPDPAAATSEMFQASQLLIRPGVARTQAVLARELSGGSDEASRLFRQAVNLSRETERMRVEISELKSSGRQPERLAELQDRLGTVQLEQVGTQAALADYPKFRAVANSSIAMTELQGLLRPGEAYYKMVIVGGRTFAMFMTHDTARTFRVPLSANALERNVDAIRGTISVEENGELVTLPFDIVEAHKLYDALFGPIEGDLPAVTHLVFEADGAMLRLPPNLLVMDQASVDAYQARAARPGDDGFDFRGTAWLGRDRDISTTVSARSFADLRRTQPSRGTAQYIGFGQHKPTDAFFAPTSSLRGGGASDGCTWSFSAWSRPISAVELNAARQVLTGENAGRADVVTGAAFTDDAIKARSDLDQYRIVHFATHGMLAPPRPECPARPALMTSFGGSGSDGLLSFGEIFDMKLDADVIILSACDTAGRASLVANEEAGITNGGDFALDGLVRAFVGAGGRLVVASHWPVPDEYNATQRLISGMFEAPPGTGTAAALRASQRKLMDDPLTSHPFYWSAFAVVGDGTLPLVAPEATKTAALN